MTAPDLATGQKVWVEGRQHPTLKGYMDCYGHISHFDEFRAADANDVFVYFPDSETMMMIPTEEFYSWNDRNNSWSVYLNDLEDYECNTRHRDQG